MSKPGDVEKFIERMTVYTRRRGLRSNTVDSFSYAARRFFVHADEPNTGVTTQDVEGYLLDLARKGRSPPTCNVHLSAVRCLLTASIGDKNRASRFGKIRHFGLMASGNLNTKLERARALAPTIAPAAATVLPTAKTSTTRLRPSAASIRIFPGPTYASPSLARPSCSVHAASSARSCASYCRQPAPRHKWGATHESPGQCDRRCLPAVMATRLPIVARTCGCTRRLH